MNHKEHIDICILHVAYSKKAPVGIQQQMQFEHEAVNKINIFWDTVLFSTLENIHPFMIHINPALPTFLQWLKVYWWVFKKRKEYDIILFRNIKADFIGWIFVKFIKRIVTVHHSKEIEECKLVRPKYYGITLSWIEKTFGNKKIRRVKGIAAVTNEIAKYELERINKKKRTIIIPNGINTDSKFLLPDKRSDNAKAVFISSSFEEWHGLELVLSSYLENPESVMELHLIGHVGNKYIDIIQLINKIKPIIFLHGILKKSEMIEILSHADIGLASFALFKENLHEACTLKVREYLAGGIPVYAGHIDSGLPPDFPYYFRGKPDIREIEKQAIRCRTIPREKIIEAARPFIDKAMIIERAYRDLTAFC